MVWKSSNCIACFEHKGEDFMGARPLNSFAREIASNHDNADKWNASGLLLKYYHAILYAAGADSWLMYRERESVYKKNEPVEESEQSYNFYSQINPIILIYELLYVRRIVVFISPFFLSCRIYVKDLLTSGVENGFAELHPCKYRVVSATQSYIGEIQVGVTFTLKVYIYIMPV